MQAAYQAALTQQAAAAQQLLLQQQGSQYIPPPPNFGHGGYNEALAAQVAAQLSLTPGYFNNSNINAAAAAAAAAAVQNIMSGFLLPDLLEYHMPCHKRTVPVQISLCPLSLGRGSAHHTLDKVIHATADASGHGKGPDRDYDNRRGGRERRGHRGSRRDHDRERERDRDRERDLDQDGANQFASRFQSIEEVLGQVSIQYTRILALSGNDTRFLRDP